MVMKTSGKDYPGVGCVSISILMMTHTIHTYQKNANCDWEDGLKQVDNRI